MQEGKLCPNLFTLPAASASPHTFRQHTATFSGWFLSENLSFCPYWCFTFGIADMLTVYMASVSGSLEVKKNQERIFSVLTSKKIAFKQVDITQNTEDKNLMRKKANNPTALPPQIFNGDVYCGDINAFNEAIENEELEKFLKL
ncbi:SH3 domain-binding glutamic acid-rich-like protein 3 [Xiphophorus maculatus]|nr:SH3 domain-binding glutamic acid-rich-like protein 3 [Xiphophorus maculatus]